MVGAIPSLAGDLRPYCGEAPSPGGLLSQWNFDPWLLLALFLLSGAYALAARRSAFSRGHVFCFAGAMAALALAFISPLCAWSSALFSARVAHHLLIIGLAAPLLAFSVRTFASPPLAAAAVAQTFVVWFWHAPGSYAWALSDPAAYWVMEISLLGASAAFWASVRARMRDPIRAVAALALSMVQMGLLGAILTFAPQPLFRPHFGTTLPWGLTPLQDQQLAGVLMWAPGALPYLAAALAVLGVLLRDAPPAALARRA